MSKETFGSVDAYLPGSSQAHEGKEQAGDVISRKINTGDSSVRHVDSQDSSVYFVAREAGRARFGGTVFAVDSVIKMGNQLVVGENVVTGKFKTQEHALAKVTGENPVTQQKDQKPGFMESKLPLLHKFAKGKI